MKKHWKKIILVLAILLLSVAGYLLYIFQFKEYETADENVDQVVEEEYKVELPDGSTIIVDKDGNVIEGSDAAATDGEVSEDDTAKGGSASNTASTGNTSADDSATGSTEGTSPGSSTSGDSATAASGTAHSSSNGSNPDQASGSKSSTGTTGSSGSAAGGSDAKAGSGSPNTGSSNTGSSNAGSTGKESAGTESGGVTVASIKQKYEPTLADIEGQAASRINGLISAAQSEYATKKANGENINYAYFYNKYMGAATELENRTDTVFYAVIGSLKNELKANGLAASHADSFVSEYEARKEARKKDLISKASGM